MTCHIRSRSFAMCVLALDCSLVDLRNCRMMVPLAGGKVAVHICQALMRMQHCDIAGGNCSVLASHSAICNISHVQLHSIDSVGIAAGARPPNCTKIPFVTLTFTLQSPAVLYTHMQSSWILSVSLPSPLSAPWLPVLRSTTLSPASCNSVIASAQAACATAASPSAAL